MKVGVDIRCLLDGRTSGVEEYTKQILIHLFEKEQNSTFVLFINSFSPINIDLSWAEKYPNVQIKKYRIPNKILNFMLWYFRYPKIDKLIGGVDVFFVPNLNFVSISSHARLILTLHDLSFEMYPETFSLKRRLWHMFINPRRLCTAAHHIIAVSNSTKNDIVRLYRITEDKISTIYSGIDSNFLPNDRNDINLLKVRDKYKLPYRFILSLATIEPRKNIQCLVYAYEQYRDIYDRRGETKLVIAGIAGWKSKEIFQTIFSSRYAEDILYIGNIDHTEKCSLFTLATLFTFPSWYEGFGFPLLEAMRCRVPSVAGFNSSLPEIGGDTILYVDPEKPQDLALAMNSLLSDRDFSEKIALQSQARSMRFDWKKSADETLSVLKYTSSQA